MKQEKGDYKVDQIAQRQEKFNKIETETKRLIAEGKAFTQTSLWESAGYKRKSIWEDRELAEYITNKSELSFIQVLESKEQTIKNIAKQSQNIEEAVTQVRKELNLNRMPFIAKCKLEFLIIDSNPEIKID